MLYCGHGFAGRNRYGIHPTKTLVLTYLYGPKTLGEVTYTMAGLGGSVGCVSDW